MATKKYLKKGKKGYKKRHGMRGGAPIKPIKISYDKVKQIVTTIFENSIRTGQAVTNVVIANAIFEVLGGAMGRQELAQMRDLAITIFASSLQFVLSSLTLTASVISTATSQVTSATSFIAGSLWSAAQAISNVCSKNPTAAIALGSAATGAIGTLAVTTDLPNIIRTQIQRIGYYGVIDSVSVMLFDLLIKSGYFQDEEYNQLTIEDLPQNEVNNVVDSIVSSSRENTPEPSPASSQGDEEDDEEKDIDVPALTDEDIERLVGTLNSMESQINSLLKNIKNYDDLSEAFEEDVKEMPSICHIKRKNIDEEEPVYEAPSNAKNQKISDNYDNDPPPSFDDSSSSDEEEEKKPSGGKRTRHRKRKHNKNKTKKIKHAKKHTKKHKKHMKKHTKKH
jgi:hypothetical protein